MPHFKERLNEILKQRISFNGEFAEMQTSHIIVAPLKQRDAFNFEFPLENSRMYMCAARNFALTRSLRSSRTNYTAPKSEDLLAV